jgi:hypothetical protein
MNVLMVGSGKGSWVIRGYQLGAALRARVTSDPSAADFAWAEIVILVKRAILQWGLTAKRSGKPIVWDALDFWTQPVQNTLDKAAAVALFQQHIQKIGVDVVIGATQAMASALNGVYLPHHSWDGLQPAPAREKIQVVAYEGNPIYLGRWAQWLTQACTKRGWDFVVNPPDLRAADILVAFRDGPWDGWICREWKSGVKIVNAIAAGRPLLTQESAAVSELNPHAVMPQTPAQLSNALEVLSNHSIRESVVRHSQTLAPRYTLSSVAAQYHEILERVACPA